MWEWDFKFSFPILFWTHRLLSWFRLSPFMIHLLLFAGKSCVRINMKTHPSFRWVTKKRSVSGFFLFIYFLFCFAFFSKLENSAGWQKGVVAGDRLLIRRIVVSVRLKLIRGLATRVHWAPRSLLVPRCLEKVPWWLPPLLSSWGIISPFRFFFFFLVSYDLTFGAWPSFSDCWLLFLNRNDRFWHLRFGLMMKGYII